jgi:transcriptional regulator with XRE-family HTH domain
MAKKPAPKKKREAPRQTIATQLRDLIESRGLTHYALGKLAEVSPAMISRFVSGERDLRFETAARLAAALNLRLVEVARVKGKGRSTGQAVEG